MDSARPPPEETLTEHERFVRAVSLRLLHDSEAADDNVQDTWVAALEHPPRHRGNVRGWLGVVARRLALRRRRAAGRRLARETKAAGSDRLPSTADVVRRLETQRQVLDAVQTLSEPYRTAIVLRYLHGLKPQQIAAAQSVSVETVKTRLGRALAQLRARLDREHGGRRELWQQALVPLAWPFLSVDPASPALEAVREAVLRETVLRETVLRETVLRETVLGGLAVKKKLLALGILLLLAAGYMLGRPLIEPGAKDRDAVMTAEVEAEDARLQGRQEDPVDPAAAGQTVTPRVDGAFEIAVTSAARSGASGIGDPWRRGWTSGEDKPWRVTEETGSRSDLGELRVIAQIDGDPVVAEGVVRVGKNLGHHDEISREVSLPLPGEARMTELEPGEPTVEVRLGDLARRLSVEARAGFVTELDVRFARGALVTGHVRHVLRGPQARVKLRFERAQGAWLERMDTVTEADGSYRLREVPPGRWVIYLVGGATGDNLRPRGVLEVVDASALEHEILVGVAALKGTVRDARTQEPIPGAQVKLGDYRGVRTNTDAFGAYALADIPAGRYAVRVSWAGYAVWQTEAVEIETGPARTLDVELQPCARLEMHVTDTQGQPVTGQVVLKVDAVDGTPVTTPFIGTLLDGDGRQRCTLLPPGTYDLTVRADGCEEKTVRVYLSPQGAALEAVLTREGHAGRISLQGTVTDAKTGKPVSGVHIVVTSGAHGVSLTDDLGRYVFRDLEAPSCRLLVTRAQYGYLRVEDVALDAEETVVRDIELAPAAEVDVFAEDIDGQPVTGLIMMAARPAAGTSGTRYATAYRADARGFFCCQNLVPGAYTLELTKEDVGTARLEVVLQPGANTLRARLE